MKIITFIFILIIMFFSLYFGTSIFLSLVGTNSDASDPLYTMVRDLITFNNVLLCLLFSIIILLLTIIIIELKKLNNNCDK
ncbi:hypothetical protein [Haloplasma contractile]|uniref:Uncharacterized protein n=1 Tax=Haloplasma contractile SSD-17B TaxID=1033810 RepID=U2ECK5_9MOLU|nr:hypothetical protein [Haloplasma contractile]ERJ12783.1 hypothetical protein HLPCO_001123 [Haloplasma contractile SSD-17B]